MALFAESIKKINHLNAFRREKLRVGRQGVGFYNFWPADSFTDYWLYQFLTRRPVLKRAIAGKRIAIYSVFGPRYLVGLDRSDLKLFYTGENLVRYPAYENHFADRVDLALGFDHEIGKDNYLRFPLWLKYLVPADFDFSVSQSIRSLGDREMWRSDGRKEKFAALVARHDENGIRSLIADTLSGVGQVDYGGSFRYNLTQQIGPSGIDKISFLTPYRYTICPENSNRSGYVTEKLLHAIQAGCVPIYWGSDNCPEPEVFNSAAILFFDPDQPEVLQQTVTRLEREPDTYANFSAQNRFQPTAMEFISDKIRTLEQRIIDLLKQ